jgi:AraC-like DNA-binding protein
MAVPREAHQFLAILHPAGLSRTVHTPGLHESIVDEWLRFHSALADAADTELTGVALDMLRFIVSLLDSPADPRSPVSTVRRALELDCASRRALPEMAAEHGMGYSALRTAFRRQYGVSPGEYRLRCRLRRAQELLLYTPMTIGQIADQLGYLDVFTFSAQFRRRVGIPPSDFRRTGGPLQDL